jgi:hypothetical protein
MASWSEVIDAQRFEVWAGRLKNGEPGYVVWLVRYYRGKEQYKVYKWEGVDKEILEKECARFNNLGAALNTLYERGLALKKGE